MLSYMLHVKIADHACGNVWKLWNSLMGIRSIFHVVSCAIMFGFPHVGIIIHM